MLISIEMALAAGLVVLALTAHHLAEPWLERAEETFASLAQRRKLSLLIVASVSLGLRLALLPVEPIPAPTIDDEFGYLLQADTFLHGRLTNPAHPMWQHFETMHINMLPTYQAKFPSAQGMVLAAGKLIGGRPIFGVWLSMAAMCAAICWMLQEWIAPEWALAGGLLLAIRLSAFSYWGDSYWGGAVAAIGGALVLGALARMKRSARLRDALSMGFGMAILATSRPFEGLLLCIPVAATLFFWWSRKSGKDFNLVVGRTVVPLVICVALTAVWIGYYNWRLTGDAFLLPYQLNERTYDAAPLFIFRSQPPQPVYRHAALREFYVLNDLPIYRNTQSPHALLVSWYQRFKAIWELLLGPLLAVPILFAPFAPKQKPGATIGSATQNDWRNRFLIWTGMIAFVGLCLEVYGVPHYAAPFTAMIMACALLSMRRLRGLQWFGGPAGRFLCRAIPVACLLMLGVRALAAPLHIRTGPEWPPTWYNAVDKKIPRTDVETMLKALPGQHLVIVNYLARGTTTMPHEWVYNDADIDAAKIVWAWDMGPAKDQELIDYFKGRRVWRVNSDRSVLSEASDSKSSDAARAAF